MPIRLTHKSGMTESRTRAVPVEQQLTFPTLAGAVRTLLDDKTPEETGAAILPGYTHAWTNAWLLVVPDRPGVIAETGTIYVLEEI